MAVFRVERNTGYTVMSNHHLRNKELSLKAKGLLSQMLSLPEDWDYTLAGLSYINREKIDAIREAVRELERAGYIQRSRERDEKGRFANIGQIPKFEKLIATIRSREISASIILQSQSQLKAIYKDNADTIVGNCDTTLFLGGKEKTTLKEMSEILGKETIDSFNTSENRGREVSHGLNYQKLGKQLMEL